MKELALLGSLILDQRSSSYIHSLNELEVLLKKFYARFNPSKCVCCDVLAECFLDKLPLLSSRLLSKYGSDLCCFLDYSKGKS